MDKLREELEMIIRDSIFDSANMENRDFWKNVFPTQLDSIMSLVADHVENEKAKQREDLQQDIRSVYHQLKGSTERFKIANYVEKYLLETGEKESK